METEIPATEPYQNFLFTMNSPVTRERYSTRLRYFLAKVGITDNNKSIEELCRIFLEKGKQDYRCWVLHGFRKDST